MRALDRRIELGVAFGQPLCALGRERACLSIPFNEEAEPLEHGPVAKLVCVPDQHSVVTVGPGQIGSQTIHNVLDAAARGRIVQHVHDRPVNVGYGDLRAVPPHRPRAEHAFRLDVLEREERAMVANMPRADSAGCEDNDIVEYLLGEIPMLGGRAAADIGGRPKRRDQHPQIVEHMPAVERVQRSGNIGARADATEPPLFCPAGEPFGRIFPWKIKRARGVLYTDHIARCANKVGKLGPAGRKRAVGVSIVHARHFAISENNIVFSVLSR